MKLVKGDQAPSFESIDQNGSSIRLNQFEGKKIILYFYPKDDTPGCTALSTSLLSALLLPPCGMSYTCLLIPEVRKKKTIIQLHSLFVTLHAALA